MRNVRGMWRGGQEAHFEEAPHRGGTTESRSPASSRNDRATVRRSSGTRLEPRPGPILNRWVLPREPCGPGRRLGSMGADRRRAADRAAATAGDRKRRRRSDEGSSDDGGSVPARGARRPRGSSAAASQGASRPRQREHYGRLGRRIGGGEGTTQPRGRLQRIDDARRAAPSGRERMNEGGRALRRRGETGRRREERVRGAPGSDLAPYPERTTRVARRSPPDSTVIQ